MTAEQREFDIVLYGATGFVGKLTAEYLAKAGGDARIALAGRSPDKLLAVRESLGDARAVLADPDRRRLLAVVAERHGRPDPRRRHHRRSLQPLRPAAGGRVRGGGHRLRRPHRRGHVRAAEHRRLSQGGRRHRGAHRARLRIRFRPFGHERLRAVSAGRAGRHRRTRRHQLRVAWPQRRGVRRYGGLDGRDLPRVLQRPEHPAPARGPVHPDPGPRRRAGTGSTARPAVAARP